MLGYIRNAQLSLLVILLTCPVPMAYANGDCNNSVPVKKHKKHCAKKHSHRAVGKSNASNKIESDIENDIESIESEGRRENSGCKESPSLRGLANLFHPSR